MTDLPVLSMDLVRCRPISREKCHSREKITYKITYNSVRVKLYGNVSWRFSCDVEKILLLPLRNTIKGVCLVT